MNRKVFFIAFAALFMCLFGRVSAQAITREDAVSWAEAQIGKEYDVDGYLGFQCSDFGTAYINYLIYGNAYYKEKDAYTTYMARYYFELTYPSGWQHIAYTPDLIPQPGDILCFGTNSVNDTGHVAIALEGCTSSVMYAVGQNGAANNGYGEEVKREVLSYFGGSGAFQGVIRPKWDSGGANPKGEFEECEGGLGTIKIRGWAYDPDNTSAQLDIHVYVGGPAGTSSRKAYVIKANTARPDINNLYKIGIYHGYDATIAVDKSGTQAIYVYAANVGGGNDTLLGCIVANITRDTEAPKISNARITDIDDSGYTVRATITDNIALDRAQISTWTKNNGRDDISRNDAFVSGNEISCRINTADHKNESGMYYSEIYAYDRAGNQAVYKDFGEIPVNMILTVSLNANGGEIPAESKSVAYNLTYGNLPEYGDLPIPTRADYTFLGWFTSARGGSQITRDTVVTTAEKQTLYAHWERAPKTAATLTSHGTYSICDVKITNGNGKYKLIVAAYNDDTLISVETRSAAAKSESFAIVGKCDKVKVMVWDEMKPVSEIETVEP